ncbi:MAG: class I SAM-dependent methyltransferase [Bacteroidota bacterium]
MIKCNICGSDTTQIEVQEQMLGLKEKFMYSQCINCGHAHIDNIPADMAKYYNSREYYSFSNKNSFTENNVGNGGIKTSLKKLFQAIGAKKNLLYSAALKAFLTIRNVKKEMTILDYGCGAGQFVKELVEMGFTNARGYDPFLPENISLNGELYLSGDLSLFKNTYWDLVTLNHVFEHVYDPVQTLKDIHKIMPVGGKLLLRFPVIDSFAFEKYKENWVQFDAPRHINLFTRKSLRMAVSQAGGYQVENLYDDSFHFQFTGSELYLQKLSLKPVDNSFKKRLLSPDAYRYHFLAKKLNKQNKGDQVVVILEKV